MADTRQTAPKRNDVIRCENCGEDYSVTYKRCPFCDERPGRGGRPVTGRGGSRMADGGGRGEHVNPVQIAMLIGSVILIIAALFIVFKSIAPLLGRGGDGSAVSSSAAQSQPSSAAQSGVQSEPQGSDVSSGTVSVTEPPVEPVAPAPTGVTLNRSDFTLIPGETFQITAAVTPAGVTEPVVYTSGDESALTVDEYGNVTNVYAGGDVRPVTVTVTCGDKKAECIVRCRGAGGGSTPSTGGETTTPSTGSIAPNTVAYITGAPNGLNIRSGPGTSHSVQDSAVDGAQVTVLEDAGNGFYKIRYSTVGGGSKEGYVSKDYVSTKN